MSEVRVVHYVNQFFGGIGGEEKGNHPVTTRQGPVGPGLALQKALGDDAMIVGTVIAGDNYFSENLEGTCREALEAVKGFGPDVLVAGPAFGAGRYGVACGALCEAATG